MSSCVVRTLSPSEIGSGLHKSRRFCPLTGWTRLDSLSFLHFLSRSLLSCPLPKLPPLVNRQSKWFPAHFVSPLPKPMLMHSASAASLASPRLPQTHMFTTFRTTSFSRSPPPGSALATTTPTLSAGSQYMYCIYILYIYVHTVLYKYLATSLCEWTGLGARPSCAWHAGHQCWPGSAPNKSAFPACLTQL